MHAEKKTQKQVAGWEQMERFVRKGVRSKCGRKCLEGRGMKNASAPACSKA